MENRKNKIWVIALISALTLMINSCGITITRNQYYSNPDPNQSKEIKQNKAVSKCTADTMTIHRNGQK